MTRSIIRDCLYVLTLYGEVFVEKSTKDAPPVYYSLKQAKIARSKLSKPLQSTVSIGLFRYAGIVVRPKK